MVNMMMTVVRKVDDYHSDVDDVDDDAIDIGGRIRIF